MELMTTNINTNLYIQSEFEFNQATKSGVWQKIRTLFVGRPQGLRCFAKVMRQMRSDQTVSLGLQDISLNFIIGSVDRAQDFSETFAPRQNGEGGKERWRQIYMLAVSGKGFPPISLYQIGNDYFVKDGHHRVSVARYLGWPTIQAHVTELRATTSDDPSQTNCWHCCAGEVVCA